MVVRGFEGHPRRQRVGGKTDKEDGKKHVFIHNKLHCLQNVWLKDGHTYTTNHFYYGQLRCRA